MLLIRSFINKFWKVASLVSMLALLLTFNGCGKDSITLEGTLIVKVGRHTKPVTVRVYPYESNWLNRSEELEQVQLPDKEMRTTFTLNAGNYLVSLYTGETSDIRAVQVQAGKEVVLDYTNRSN